MAVGHLTDTLLPSFSLRFTLHVVVGSVMVYNNSYGYILTGNSATAV